MRPVIAEKSYDSSCCCFSVIDKISIYPDVVEIIKTERLCGFREKCKYIRFPLKNVTCLETNSTRDPKLALIGILTSILLFGGALLIDDVDLQIYIYSISGALFLSCIAKAIYVCVGGEIIFLTIKNNSESHHLKLSIVDAHVIMDVLFPLKDDSVNMI